MLRHCSGRVWISGDVASRQLNVAMLIQRRLMAFCMLVKLVGIRYMSLNSPSRCCSPRLLENIGGFMLWHCRRR